MTNSGRGNSDRHRILEQNYEMRKNKHKPWTDLGEYAMLIPTRDYQLLVKAIPELESHDKETRETAWKVFMKHPASELYKTSTNLGKKLGVRSNNHRIIVK